MNSNEVHENNITCAAVNCIIFFIIIIYLFFMSHSRQDALQIHTQAISRAHTHQHKTVFPAIHLVLIVYVDIFFSSFSSKIKLMSFC